MPGDERYGEGLRIAAGTGARDSCQQGLFPDMSQRTPGQNLAGPQQHSERQWGENHI